MSYKCYSEFCHQWNIINIKNVHNSEPNTDDSLAVQCFRTAVKRKVEEYLHVKSNNIIRKEIQETNSVFR